MDVDTTREKDAHEKHAGRAFAGARPNVLIGTQMIAKGLDFPKVTLVGVVAADMTLNLPDYRSAERTFQLITQVAGRARRARGRSRAGWSCRPTSPEHYAMQPGRPAGLPGVLHAGESCFGARRCIRRLR